MSHDEPIDIRIESDAIAPGAARVAELRGREAISRLFDFELLLVSADPEGLDAEALAGAEATIVLSRAGEDLRRVHGLIAQVRDQLDTESRHSTYRVSLVPRAYRLSLHETVDVFMDMSVPEIALHKLGLAGLRQGEDVELRLTEQYPRREFVVQYKETDLAFVSRLLEHLGLSFFFEHHAGRDVLVITDHNAGFRPILGGAAQFRPRGERRDVYRLETETRLVPAQYVVRDYNYRTPQVDLTADAEVSTGYGGRVIEYGAHFKTPEEGARIAAVRAEEQAAQRRVFHGEAELPGLAAGAACRIEGHPFGDVDLLLTEVVHAATPTALAASAGAVPYSATFRAIKASTPYRPPRVTPKPRVHGVLTGAIDASDRGAKYAQVDGEGRYRVRFIFDTSDAQGGQASRPLRMAQPHAGPGYGMHFPLRPGVEVALTCVDGDPDRPIIMGTLPNPTTPSPVATDNAPRNIIRTGAGNEINIDDTDGSERIKLSTPHSSATLQLGSPNAPEDGVAVSAFTNFTAATGASANTLTSMGNMFGIWVNTMANHVTSIAGKLTVPMVINAVLSGIDTGLGIMSGVLDTTLSAYATRQSLLELETAKKKSALDKAAEQLGAREERLLLALDAANYGQDPQAAAARQALKDAIARYNAAREKLETDQLALDGLKAEQQAAADAGKPAAAAAFDPQIEAYERRSTTQAQKGTIQLDEEEIAAARTALEAAVAAAKAKCGGTVTLANYPKQGESTQVVVADAIAAYEGAQRGLDGAQSDYTAAKDEEDRFKKDLEGNDDLTRAGQAKDSIENTRSLVAATAGNGMALWSIYAMATGTGLDAYGALGSNLLIAEAKRQYAGGGLPKLEWVDSGWGALAKSQTTPALDAHSRIARLPWADIPTLKQAAGSGLLGFAGTDQWKEGRQIVGSEGHTVVFGKETLFLSGQAFATLSSKDKVVVTSNDRTVVHARKDTEIAGGDKVLLTSATLVDVLSRGTVKIAAVEQTPAKQDKDRTTIDMAQRSLELAARDAAQAAKASIKVSTVAGPPEEGAIELKTAAAQFLKLDENQKKTTLSAHDHFELTAARTASLLAGGAGAEWGLEVDGQNGKVDLGGRQWKLTIKDQDVSLGKAPVDVTLKADNARIRKGNSLLKLTDDRALLRSSATVQLEGQMIKANGKVLLG